MADCCKINEFDKTSQSLFFVAASGNAGVIRSGDNRSCQHFEAERGDGEKKTGLSGEENEQGLVRWATFVNLSESEAEK